MQNQLKITIWVLTTLWPLLGGQNCPVKTRFLPVLTGRLKPGWFKPFNPVLNVNFQYLVKCNSDTTLISEIV